MKIITAKAKATLLFVLGPRDGCLLSTGLLIFSQSRQTHQKEDFQPELFQVSESLNPSLFNTLKTPRFLTELEIIIGIIGVIKETVIIMAFAAQDFQVLS